MTSFMILWEYSHFLDDLYHTTLSIVLHSSCRFMVVIWTEFCEMTCITSMCVLSPVMMFTVCARYAVYQHRYVCCVLLTSALVYYVLMCALCSLLSSVNLWLYLYCVHFALARAPSPPYVKQQECPFHTAHFNSGIWVSAKIITAA